MYMGLKMSELESEREPSIHDPLLGNEGRDVAKQSIERKRLALRVSVICIVSIFLIEIGDFMSQAPSARIIEDIICRAYFSRVPFSAPNLSSSISVSSLLGIESETNLPFGSIPEENCKNDVIQGKMAMLKGWDQMFSCIPGLIMAVPYGVLADRIGRRTVLFLALIGVTASMGWAMSVCEFFVLFLGGVGVSVGKKEECDDEKSMLIRVKVYFDTVFDIRWFWASNVFIFIGGGSAVIRSMVFTIIADVVPEEHRAATFFQITATALLATFGGVPFAWWLMKRNVWIPMLVSLVFMLSGSLLVLALPETLHLRDPSYNPVSTPGAENDEEQCSEEEETLSFTQKNWRILLDKFEESRFVFTHPKIFVLSLVFLTQSIHGYINPFLLQLASKRLHWKLSEASFLIPLASGTNFTLLVVILPAIYTFLNKFHLQPAVKDLLVGRVSVIFLVVGCLGMALAIVPSLFVISTVILSLGMGFQPAIRSLVTSFVHPSQVSRLFGVLAVMDTIGGMISSPLMSGAFSMGLKKGGMWSGGAFLVAGMAYGLVGIPTWFLDVKKEDIVENDVEDSVNLPPLHLRDQSTSFSQYITTTTTSKCSFLTSSHEILFFIQKQDAAP
ncbi:Major facilitator superfamily domain general substrate transporter protein [Rutstroemia sp. NJR-2017a BVV2]|nr:Major facilitator superfamily domain general substrate transporter protein [Rutstroemia sp. NJR-2017a BVV2]